MGLRFVLWRLHSDDGAPFSFASDEVSMSKANRTFLFDMAKPSSGAASGLPSDKVRKYVLPAVSFKTLPSSAQNSIFLRLEINSGR
eukprot:4015438-Prymnesium_polylepis.1